MRTFILKSAEWTQIGILAVAIFGMLAFIIGGFCGAMFFLPIAMWLDAAFACWCLLAVPFTAHNERSVAWARFGLAVFCTSMFLSGYLHPSDEMMRCM